MSYNYVQKKIIYVESIKNYLCDSKIIVYILSDKKNLCLQYQNIILYLIMSNSNLRTNNNIYFIKRIKSTQLFNS